MRTFVLGIVTSILVLAAAPVPDPLQEACDPEGSNHTNPPILGVKGNSVVWYQCERRSQAWVPIVADYDVFDGDVCNAAAQFLDDDWFGTATEKGEAILYRKSKEKKVSGVKLKSDAFTLKIKFTSPRGHNPNVIELCKAGGRCCELQAASDQSLQGKMPNEFEGFDDAKIGHGFFRIRKGQTPLQFETCLKVGCVH